MKYSMKHVKKDFFLLRCLRSNNVQFFFFIKSKFHSYMSMLSNEMKTCWVLMINRGCSMNFLFFLRNEFYVGQLYIIKKKYKKFNWMYVWQNISCENNFDKPNFILRGFLIIMSLPAFDGNLSWYTDLTLRSSCHYFYW